MTAGFAFSHVTIVVSDLARAEHFYAALGFERLHAAEPDAAFKTLLERQTRMAAGPGRFMMCADPDGLRPLLMETPS